MFYLKVKSAARRTLCATTLAAAPAVVLVGLLPHTAGAQDGTVTVVLPDEPETLEGCQAMSNSVGRVNLGNIVEALTVRDTETGELTPQLATSWSRIDDLTWRFELREGVTFHDGSTFDAAAAKRAIDRTMRQDLSCETRTKFFGERALEVNVVDDTTIDITTEIPDPILPLLMSTHVIYAIESADEPVKREAVGTGPFVLADWPAGQQIVLERYADYWGDQPAVETAVFQWRSESSVRTAMVKQGEADLAPIIAPQDVTDELGVSYPNSETTRLNLDLLLPPMDDIRVRAAINFAIDREALKVTVGPDVIQATHMFVPQISGYNPDIPLWPYDPDRARELLNMAKVDGVPVDAEIEFVGRIGHFPGVFEMQEAITAMLNEVGLNVRLQMYEAAQKNKMQTRPYAEGRPPQIFVDQHDNNKGDAVFTAAAKWRSDSGQSKTEDTYLDYLMDYASQQEVGPKRVEAWHRVMERVEALVPNAMLYHMVGYAAVGPRINYQPNLETNNSVNLASITFN